jgi:ferritin
MISEAVEQEFNKQINEELYSSYLYLAMAACFEAQNLDGFANWMKVQAQEENFHAMKFYDFLNERGGRVKLMAIAEPDAEWPDPLAAFEAAYKHEQHISARIDHLVDVAEEAKDRPAISFLQWFVNEQVEEEANADRIVNQLQLMKDAPGGIFMLDRELGQRVFNAPAESAE